MFFLRTLLEIAGLNAILALSVYATMTVGQLSLAQVGFMAIGAYLGGGLTTLYGFPLLPAVFVTGLVCAVLGLLIGYPCLRIRGMYLTLATVGFSEMVRVGLVNLDYQIPVGGRLLGPADALGFRNVAVMTYWPQILLALVIFTLLFAWIGRSRLGLAAAAIRNDEAAALAVGLPVTRIKLGMFALGGFIAGSAGCLYATYTSYVIGTDFGFDRALSSILYVAVGGVTTVLGPIIGALVMTLLPETVRFAGDMRMVVFGLLVLALTVACPMGLIPTLAQLARRWRTKPRRDARVLGQREA